MGKRKRRTYNVTKSEIRYNFPRTVCSISPQLDITGACIRSKARSLRPLSLFRRREE
jgi:hypothetical protein